jgi:hypothetical protein
VLKNVLAKSKESFLASMKLRVYILSDCLRKSSSTKSPRLSKRQEKKLSFH